MDARSRNTVGRGDAPRRLGCNWGGALVVLEAEKVRILGEVFRPVEAMDESGAGDRSTATKLPEKLKGEDVKKDETRVNFEG
ncbi:hypothetical protein IGI04_018389 [Brassica rapa subsp. trilocularis]|uniref:Uncharacterized protein n=1 Tax=Brassica rapa subsp. trilocularis TaxID=1813537 RepID=A0ABQ7MDX1_BRACM|nr:hypothetical protein IGI04_018389 [Brassica rapa subsp. trilocularis]